jgi:D-glycero-D-manno-heptose 1,7-bisphosphate phosphatase
VNQALNSLRGGPLNTVFLDRDGVLNEKMPEGRYVTRWEEFHLLPGVVEAIQLLNQAELRVIVVSNQRGIALGLYTDEAVRAIHARFAMLLAVQGAYVDGFYFCPHDKGECNCRKPLGGMFDQALEDFPEIKASESVMIGDSKVDVEFGQRLGMTTIFIDGDPDRQGPGAETARAVADGRFPSLLAAVKALLAGAR